MKNISTLHYDHRKPVWKGDMITGNNNSSNLNEAFECCANRDMAINWRCIKSLRREDTYNLQILNLNGLDKQTCRTLSWCCKDSTGSHASWSRQRSEKKKKYKINLQVKFLMSRSYLQWCVQQYNSVVVVFSEGTLTHTNPNNNIHPSIHCLWPLYLFYGVAGVFFFCWSQSQLSLGEGRVHPGQVASSSQGPHWWQRLPCKVPRSNYNRHKNTIQQSLSKACKLVITLLFSLWLNDITSIIT